MSEMSLLEFYEKYCTIIDSKGNRRKPILTNTTRWLLENLEKGNIQRVYTRKYGWQYKIINDDYDDVYVKKNRINWKLRQNKDD